MQIETIRAPFDGVLGIRQVNLGQYINPGDPIVGLQALEEKAVLRWGRRHGKSRATYADLIRDPELIAAMQAGVDRANTRLERWETVKRFAILDYDMSNNKDLVTTSLKVRRSVVAQQFRDLYESLYETDETTA